MVSEGTIGGRLAQLRREKAARERRELPPTLAAQEVGVTASAYSRWEADLRTPSEQWLGALARYYATTIPFIHYGVGGNEKPAPRKEAGSFTADQWRDVTAEAEAALAAEETEQASETKRRKNGGRK